MVLILQKQYAHVWFYFDRTPNRGNPLKVVFLLNLALYPILSIDIMIALNVYFLYLGEIGRKNNLFLRKTKITLGMRLFGILP